MPSVVTHSRSALYDLVLLAHVLAVVVALVVLALAGASAWRLAQVPEGVALPEVLARYYRPGINWAGRMLMAVPVFGIALMALSQGDWTYSDAWVTVGFALWFVAAGVAEAVIWPAERLLQASVAGTDPDVDRVARARTVVRWSVAVEVLLVVTSVLMVVKPG